jgi:hypothetical membrane protein
MTEANRRAAAGLPAEPAPETPSRTAGVRVTLGRNIVAIVAWGFVAAIVVQVYLAGIGVFRGNFEMHATFGHLLEIVAIAMLILLILVRGSRLQIGLSVLLLVLVVVQNVFIAVRETNPELAALHPVNAVAILVAAIVLARTTWRLGGLSDL